VCSIEKFSAAPPGFEGNYEDMFPETVAGKVESLFAVAVADTAWL